MILLKKAVRGIWRNKKAYIACIVLMAIGIAVYVAYNLLYVNLTAARENMYRQQRFADVFARVKAMPLSEAEALLELPGVERVSASLTVDARVQGFENGKIVTLCLTSYDPEEEERLNDFLLTRGALPADNEIILGQAFFEANGLRLGDQLTLIAAGKQIRPAISGTALSPEYVYAIPEGGSLMPDPEAYGFAYMPYQELALLLGRSGGADTISCTLKESFEFDDVKFYLEDALDPYGLESLVKRADQSSDNMLTTEIDSLGAMSQSMPMVFIGMAVIILYIMLKRVIEQERLQIGILKAFGLTDGEIIRHYLCYGLFIGGVGGLLGVAGGLALSGMMTELYLVYFNLPNLAVPPDWRYIAAGMAIAVGAGGLGSYMGTHGLLKLRPSEAMRPPAPPPVKSDVVGKLRLLRGLLTSYGYMAVRNITRNKFRSLFVVCGIAFSFCITAFMGSYNQMMDVMMFQQFTKVQMYDMRVTLLRPQRYSAALEEALALRGVDRAEGLLEIPVELRHGHLKEGVALTAMEEDSTLYRIFDSDGNFWLKPPRGGLILSVSLADKLQARRGDLLTMTTPYSGDEELPVPVLDIVQSYLGSSAYLSLDSLCALLEVPLSVNSVLIASGDTAQVKAALEDANNVSALTDTGEAMQIYSDMLESYALMLYMLQLAGLGIAFAIITNTASISLSERKREYATMRVLGMRPGEIGGMVSFEYWILTVAGIIPGIPLTYLVKVALADVMNTEMFSLPLSTPLSAYLSAALCCAAAVLISNVTSTRQISKFDMVEVLKERE